MFLDLIIAVIVLALVAYAVLFLMEYPARKRRNDLISFFGLTAKHIGKTVDAREVFQSRFGTNILSLPLRITQLSNNGAKNLVWEMCEIEPDEAFVFENKLTGLYKVFFTQTVVCLKVNGTINDIGAFRLLPINRFPGEGNERISKVETRTNSFNTGTHSVITRDELVSSKQEAVANVLMNSVLKNYNFEASNSMLFCYKLNHFMKPGEVKSIVAALKQVLDAL